MKLILPFIILIFSQTGAASDCKKLPTKFEEARIYLRLTAKSEEFLFYTDSGGGLKPFTYEDVAKKMHLSYGKFKYDEKIHVAQGNLDLSLFKVPLKWHQDLNVFKYNPQREDEPSFIRFMIGDGFLGASLFADSIWYLNYAVENLSICTVAPQLKNAVTLNLGFKVKSGARTSHQPLIKVSVNGKELSLLFDTGATSNLSKEAQKILAPKHSYTSSSFIRESVANEWLKANPKWKRIIKGDSFAGGGDLIEVPQVEIGGIKVGPVWFATRKDNIYDHYSENYMPARIDGAIGGNALKFFEMVIDYPASLIHFKPI